MEDEGWRVEGGGWRVKDRGSRVEDGWWRVEDREWKMKDGEWRMEDEGRRVKGGGWRSACQGFRAGFASRGLQFSKAILRWQSCSLLEAEPWGWLVCDPRGRKVFQKNDHLSCRAG